MIFNQDKLKKKKRGNVTTLTILQANKGYSSLYKTNIYIYIFIYIYLFCGAVSGKVGSGIFHMFLHCLVLLLTDQIVKLLLDRCCNVNEISTLEKLKCVHHIQYP